MDEYENPRFPEAEMYHGVPGPVLLRLRKKFNIIILTEFAESEIQAGRKVLALNDTSRENQ